MLRCRCVRQWGVNLFLSRVHARSGAPWRSPARDGMAGAGRTGRERSDVKRRARRFCLPATWWPAAAALVLTTTLQAAPAAQAAEVAHAAGFTANLTWSTTLPDGGNPIALSSPNVANLDGQPAVVVGDRAGKVYAYHLSNGSAVGRLALQRRRAGRLLAVGRPHFAQRHRLGLRRQRRADRSHRRWLPGHHQHRG